MALYETLKSALVFDLLPKWDKKHMKFTMTSYDPCVANKTLNGHQMITTWHIVDISHADHEEITLLANSVALIYCDIIVMRVK